MKLKNTSVVIISTIIVLIVVYLLTTSYRNIDKTYYEDSSKIVMEINTLVDDYKKTPSIEVVIDFESIN